MPAIQCACVSFHLYVVSMRLKRTVQVGCQNICPSLLSYGTFRAEGSHVLMWLPHRFLWVTHTTMWPKVGSGIIMALDFRDPNYSLSLSEELHVLTYR